MAKYRIYPSKSNTLLEGSRINTSENEVTELWYGNEGIARYLVRFNFDAYNAEYAAGRAPHITAATATFHMENCYPIFERAPYTTATSPSAADIEVQVVQQFWDAGAGYDFYGTATVNDESNWYSATSTQPWAAAGGDFLYTVFSGTVEKGRLNFSGDVANEIELWNVFTGDNYGFVVKYAEAYEDLSGSTKTILKYFTENAKTKYKMPYIEMAWDDQVKDERDDVSPGTTKRLYLYCVLNGNLTNAVSVSSVTITYSTTAVTSSSTTSISNPMPGVYYIELTYPTTGATGVTFTDTWRVQYSTGQPYTSVVKTGVTVPVSNGWTTTIGATYSDYIINVPQMASAYPQGTRVYLEVQPVTRYTSTVNILKNMSYKIDLIDGQMRIPFVDWEPVSYSHDENFVTFDTSWMHVGYQYALSFRYTVDGTTVYTPHERKFRIV